MRNSKLVGIFAFVLMCLLFSCATAQHGSYKSVSIAQPDETIEGEWFNNSFELDRIVPLETTENFVMSSALQRFVQFKNNLIFFDYVTASVFVADASTGKIKTKICRKGRGPGEWHVIIDIAFDEQNEEILVYNDYQKLIHFNLDGTFLNEANVNKKLYSEMIFYNGNLIFFGHGQGISIYPYLIDIYNLADHSWKTIGTKQKVDFNRRNGRSLVRSKNIWFTPTLDMGFHILDIDSMVIKVPYRLVVRNPLTKRIQKLHNNGDSRSFDQEVGRDKILYTISSIRETEKYIAFYTNRGFMMLNKNSLQIQSMWFFTDKYLGIRLYRYNAHDGDDNRIMFMVHSDEWLKRVPYPNSIPEHLKTQIENVKVDEKIESNPILVFYKEKK